MSIPKDFATEHRIDTAYVLVSALSDIVLKRPEETQGIADALNTQYSIFLLGKTGLVTAGDVRTAIDDLLHLIAFFDAKGAEYFNATQS